MDEILTDSIGYMRSLTRETLKIFWNHSKKYPLQLAILLLGVLGVPIIQAYAPLLYRDIINLLSGERSPTIFGATVHILFIILILHIVSIIIRRILNLAEISLAASVMKDLSNMCYRMLHKHSFGFFSSNFVGGLVTKVKRYERAYERLQDQVAYDMGRALLITISIIIVFLWQYPIFGLILLIWTIIFLAFAYRFALYKLPYDIRQADQDTRVTSQLADSITNNINIKLFTNYQFETTRFDDVTQTQAELRKKSWRLGVIGDLVQSILWIILEIGMMYLAIKFWLEGNLQVGDVALVQIYLMRVLDNLWNTAKNTKNIYEALADANEMTEILIRSQDITDAPGASPLQIEKGKIDFKNASFGYHEGVAVLDNFNLEINPGERIAFVGPSGGGKSTIIKLLFRFYDVESGEIEIDGQNISKITQDSLRKALALVPQDPILFHRSLMENIRYARPSASDADVMEAAKLAHVHEFATSFPQGYDTYVGERGIKLSGGERQRVAIARALLKNAPILVLDEATSSLDSESEMFIQEALKKLMHGRTTIVVAHRLSTIMQMDRILVIEGGKIIEQGKHQDLLKIKEGTYQKLWEIQAGGFAS